MSQDYLEVLKAFKAEIVEENEIKADTISLIEDVNPSLSKSAKSFKESSKIIFKVWIEDSNAKELGSMVINTNGYDINNLIDYKNKIYNKCGILTVIGENPTEILVYATKGLGDKKLFINAIKDVIKSLYITDSEKVIEGFRNILKDWTWNNCIDLVLESTQELNINELKDEVYLLLEKRKHNRMLTIKTLYSIEATEYYNDILNFLVAQKNESREELEILRDCIFYFININESNAMILYKNYLELSFKTEVGNILIAGIRKGLNESILNHIERALKNPEYDSYKAKKIIRFLSRCKSERITSILMMALSQGHLDKNMITIAIGDRDLNLQLNTAKDKEKPLRSRVNSIISLAKYRGNENIESMFKSIAEESSILKVAVASSLVERGNVKEIITLFSEIVKREETDDIAVEAINQIRRLRGLNDKYLNDNLLKVADKLMNVDDRNSRTKVLKIVELFSNGIPSEEIGVMFLNKLNTTHHSSIRNKILNFYSRNYNRFSISLKNKIKDSIVTCTRDDINNAEAMRCLESINSFVDDTPILGI